MPCRTKLSYTKKLYEKIVVSFVNPFKLGTSINCTAH